MSDEMFSEPYIDVHDQLVVERQHAFRTAGTYFVTVRVAAHRDGDTATPYARIHNLARVRVVVGES